MRGWWWWRAVCTRFFGRWAVLALGFGEDQRGCSVMCCVYSPHGAGPPCHVRCTPATIGHVGCRVWRMGTSTAAQRKTPKKRHTVAPGNCVGTGPWNQSGWWQLAWEALGPRREHLRLRQSVRELTRTACGRSFVRCQVTRFGGGTQGPGPPWAVP
jgi:hypothetical protein